MNSSYSVHHICSFIAKKQLSGHSYSVPALCESMSKEIDTHLHVTKPSNLVFNPSFKVHQYPINLRLKPILSSKKFKSGLKKIVRNGDIIHNHGLWRMPNIYPLSTKKDKDIKIIVSPRGSLSQAALSISKYKKYIFSNLFQQNELLKKCDGFHATSIKEKDEIRKLGYKQPIAIIPNGIDMPLKAKSNFNQKKIKYLFLGRIHPIKGLDLLIRTWAKIDNKNISLDICGYSEDLNYYKYLKNITNKLNIKNITFSGSVSGESKKQKFIENDIFILPSKSENFGIVIAEAMSYGLPVITTNNTPWEIIKKNNYGWIINLNNDEIYSAILSATNLDTDNLKKMGSNGRDYIKNYFSWESLEKDYHILYNWLFNDSDVPHFVDILK